MLRKLFISLFIFSILSTDGTVNIPAGIFDFYMSAASGYNLDGYADAAEDRQCDAAEVAGQHCHAFEQGSFVLSENSIGRFPARDIFTEFVYVEWDAAVYESAQLIGMPSLIREERIVFTSSDSSPPQIL